MKMIMPAWEKNVTVKIITNHRYLISIYTHPVVILEILTLINYGGGQ